MWETGKSKFDEIMSITELTQLYHADGSFPTFQSDLYVWICLMFALLA